MAERFANRIVVVTGASAGIGAAAARRFAAEGARIVLAARGVTELEAVAREIGPERALAVPTDVTDPAAARRLLDRAVELEDVPDVVFSQPMSTADDVAALILDSAADGAAERVLPASTAYLATLGYLVPQIPRLLRPLLERRGRAAKRQWVARRRDAGTTTAPGT